MSWTCNCHCHFCDIWKLAQPPEKSFARLDDVYDNLKQAKNLGTRFVDFTGGEPLLHKDLSLMLEKAKSLGYLTSITTNTLLYPNQAESLHNKVDFLHFSLDAIDESLQDQIRGKQTFKSVMQSIKLAKRLGETPDLLYTVTNDNFEQLEKLAQFAHQQKLILIVNPVFSHTSTHNLDIKNLKKLLTFKRPYTYINKAIIDLHLQMGNQKSSPRCYAASAVIVITPENKYLLPCYHKANQEYLIENNLEEIFHNPKIVSQRKKQGRHPFCQGCAINCYFDPSFQYQFDSFFIKSILAKSKYGFDKYIRKNLTQNDQAEFD